MWATQALGIVVSMAPMSLLGKGPEKVTQEKAEEKPEKTGGLNTWPSDQMTMSNSHQCLMGLLSL